MLYMCQYDSNYGMTQYTDRASTRKTFISSKIISLQDQYPVNIKLVDAGTKCVVEFSGIFTMIEIVRDHVKGEAKDVSSLPLLMLHPCE